MARSTIAKILKELRGHLGADVPGAALDSCGLILSCVGRHTPRALLNRMSYTRAIPAIEMGEMGTAFRVDHSGRVVARAGGVVIIGPAVAWPVGDISIPTACGLRHYQRRSAPAWQRKGMSKAQTSCNPASLLSTQRSPVLL